MLTRASSERKKSSKNDSQSVAENGGNESSLGIDFQQIFEEQTEPKSKKINQVFSNSNGEIVKLFILKLLESPRTDEKMKDENSVLDVSIQKSSPAENSNGARNTRSQKRMLVSPPFPSELRRKRRKLNPKSDGMEAEKVSIMQFNEM